MTAGQEQVWNQSHPVPVSAQMHVLLIDHIW